MKLWKVWLVTNVVIVLVEIGALGVVSKKFEKYVDVAKLEIDACEEIMQKAALLRTARL